MNITVVSGNFPKSKCGVGDYSDILYSQIKNIDEKINIDVITSKGLKCSNSNVKTYDIVDKWGFSELFKIIKNIKRLNSEIVHIQYPSANYGKSFSVNILPIFIKLMKKKCITTIHEYSGNSMLGKIRIWPNILFSDKVIVVDENYKEDIKKISVFKNKCIDFVNIFSNIPKSEISEEEREKLRDKININKNDILICYFGFIHEKKGVESILKSLKILLNDNISTKLLIVGELNKNNDYHNKLIDIVNNLGINENVITTGYLEKEEVSRYISISDIGILPFKEGLSPKNGSFLSIYQEGIPVITTRASDNKELNYSGVYFIDSYDCIEQIVKLVKHIEENRNKIEVSNLISSRDIAEKHIKIYKELLKG